VEVDFFRIDYDIERAAGAQIAAGLPEIYAEITRRGISLDAMMAEQEAGQKAAVAPLVKKETVKEEEKAESIPPEETVEIVREVTQTDTPAVRTPRKRVKKVNEQE
jgi:hypothetical protein